MDAPTFTETTRHTIIAAFVAYAELGGASRSAAIAAARELGMDGLATVLQTTAPREGR